MGRVLNVRYWLHPVFKRSSKNFSFAPDIGHLGRDFCFGQHSFRLSLNPGRGDRDGELRLLTLLGHCLRRSGTICLALAALRQQPHPIGEEYITPYLSTPSLLRCSLHGLRGRQK